jgi:hypothetical protein
LSPDVCKWLSNIKNHDSPVNCYRLTEHVASAVNPVSSGFSLQVAVTAVLLATATFNASPTFARIV